MQYYIYIDDGNKNGQTFSQHNIPEAFRDDFGQVLVGKHDSPLKLVQGKIDRFNDLLLADI